MRIIPFLAMTERSTAGVIKNQIDANYNQLQRYFAP
jgi:hypothetical protein